MAKALGVLVVLCGAIQVGCWKTAATFYSPDSRHTVTIKEWPLGPDSSIWAEFSAGLLPVTVNMRGDAWLGFTHCSWSADSSKAGLLVTNRLGDGPIMTGFDTKTRVLIPFDRVRSMVANDIEGTYGLTAAELSLYNGDPVEWALRDPDAYLRPKRQTPGTAASP